MRNRDFDPAADSTDVEATRQKQIITDEMRRRYRQSIRNPRTRYQGPAAAGPSNVDPMTTVEEIVDERQPLLSHRKMSVNQVSSSEDNA